MDRLPEYSRDLCLIWLSLIGKPSVTIINALLSEFGSYENIWIAVNDGAGSEILAREHPRAAERLKDRRIRDEACRIYYEIQKRKIKTVTFEDGLYPPLMKETDSPPPVLYYYGTLPEEKDGKMRLVSIVGSRNSTSYGRMMTRKISSELAGAGIGIVSGLAVGIDTEAHQGALDAGGYTVAVVANSVDYIYPKENKYLYDSILESGGCVISELIPGSVPERRFFPARNRIIGGMSELTIITEGRKSSGAMITVDRALAYSRTVMALPGNITCPSSEACNYLIKSGCAPLLSSDDVLEELGIKGKKSIAGEPGWLMGLDPLQAVTAKAIFEGAQTVDEIALRTGKPIRDIISSVTMLEIRGVAEVNRDGGYCIKI